MATRFVGVESTDPWLPDVVKTKAAQSKIVDAAGNFTATDVEGALAELSDELDDVVATGGGLPAASDAETIAGTLTTKAVTPAGLKYERPYFDVRTYGAVGDGVADDTAAIQAALTAAGSAKTLLVFSPGRYKVTATLDVASNTVIEGRPGAKLVNNSTTAGVRLLRLSGVSDVTIERLELDGAKSSFAPVDEQRHNLFLQGASRVTIRDVYSHDAKGDGLYIGLTTTPSVGVTVDNCRFEGNHRNNCSVSSAQRVMFSNCRFIAASGTAPQSGVDIEPTGAADLIDDISFVGCSSVNNVGGGLICVLNAAPTAVQKGISWIGGQLSGSTDPTTLIGVGAKFYAPNDVRLVGVQIINNAAEGVYAVSAATGAGIDGNLLVSNCNVSDNGRSGITVNNTYNVAIIGCDMINNGSVTTNTFDAIVISPSVAASGYQIIGCRMNGSVTRYGLRVGANASKVSAVGNSYGTFGTANQLLSDPIASRIRIENEPRPTVSGAKGSNAALGSLLTALTNLGLITDSTTT